MFASIDIGTNTVLLLVAELKGSGLKVIYEDERRPRLGKNVDHFKNLDPGSMKRVIRALSEFGDIIDERYPKVEEVIVTATSAVRDAANKETFLKRVRERVGYSVKLLAGDEEAEFTYLGALTMLESSYRGRPSVVIDIGGGSTELAVGVNEQLQDRHSFDMGSVRFTERFLVDDPPTNEQVDECKADIRKILNARLFQKEGIGQAILIGVAGTVTSLAMLEYGMYDYRPEELNNRILPIDIITKWIDKIIKQGSNLLMEENPELMKGRADVFLAGLLIMKETMDFYSKDKLVISTGGIRHGAILKLAGK